MDAQPSFQRVPTVLAETILLQKIFLEELKYELLGALPKVTDNPQSIAEGIQSFRTAVTNLQKDGIASTESRPSFFDILETYGEQSLSNQILTVLSGLRKPIQDVEPKLRLEDALTLLEAAVDLGASVENLLHFQNEASSEERELLVNACKNLSAFETKENAWQRLKKLGLVDENLSLAFM